MKKYISFILFSIILQPFLLNTTLIAQDQNAGDIANALVDRLKDALDFPGWSEGYKVSEHKIVYFDLDLNSNEAILYLRFHPINKFKIHKLGFENSEISISDRFYEIICETGNNIIVAPYLNKMFFKSNSEIREIDIEIETTPNQKKRIVLNNINPFKMILNDSNENEKKVADFYLYNTKVMKLDISRYLESKIVWEISGNIGTPMSLNTSRGTLYFRNGSPKGTWAKVQKTQ